jgi:hypothetical protein
MLDADEAVVLDMGQYEVPACLLSLLSLSLIFALSHPMQASRHARC